MTTDIEPTYVNYVNAIKKNLGLKETEWYFKSDPAYTYVLEHVTEDIGNRYFNEIKTRFSSHFSNHKDLLIKLSEKNDLYGKTQKCHFNGFSTCSPTNLRYILHSFLIFEHIKKLGLDNLDIIEIGGGYGGLCFFVKSLAPIFDIHISSYSIFDLEYASLLQNKYLNILGVENFNVRNLNNFNETDIRTGSFLISNYAFSEISLDIQKLYTKKVLNPYVKHGFICWNCSPLYKFMDNINVHIEKASRVPNDQLFKIGPNVSPLENYTIDSSHNWIEESLVTF